MTKREAAEQRTKLCAIVQKYDGCLYRRCDDCVLNVKDKQEKKEASHEEMFEIEKLDNMKIILDRAAMNNGVMVDFDKVLYFILSNMKYVE